MDTDQDRSSSDNDNPSPEWTRVARGEDLPEADVVFRAEVTTVDDLIDRGPLAGPLLDAADERSGDVFGAMSDLFANELAYDSLLEDHLVSRGLYIEYLLVPEQLRGYRWGSCAFANLLSALELENILVLCHLPMDGNEFREPAAKTVKSFGAQRFASTETFWWHTEQRAQEAAIESYLTGPLGDR